MFSLNLAVRIFPSVSPLWHHDGGFTGAAGEGEDEVDDALLDELLDDDNDAGADTAVPDGTRTTGPGWKCDPPCLGGPLRSIVAGSGCGPPVSLLSCPRFLKAANLCRFLLATIRLDLCFLGFARGARGALLGRGTLRGRAGRARAGGARAGGRGALRGRAGAREEYATLGGSDGGLAPPRDLDFQAFQPRACDIAERSGISFENDL